MLILSSFILGFQKVIYFHVRQLEMPKDKKETSSALPVFFHCMAKNKDIALKFGLCVCCLYVDFQHIVRFFVTPKSKRL